MKLFIRLFDNLIILLRGILKLVIIISTVIVMFMFGINQLITFSTNLNLVDWNASWVIYGILFFAMGIGFIVGNYIYKNDEEINN